MGRSTPTLMRKRHPKSGTYLHRTKQLNRSEGLSASTRVMWCTATTSTWGFLTQTSKRCCPTSRQRTQTPVRPRWPDFQWSNQKRLRTDETRSMLYWWDHPTGFTLIKIAQALEHLQNGKLKQTKSTLAEFSTKVTVPGVAFSNLSSSARRMDDRFHYLDRKERHFLHLWQTRAQILQPFGWNTLQRPKELGFRMSQE